MGERGEVSPINAWSARRRRRGGLWGDGGLGAMLQGYCRLESGVEHEFGGLGLYPSKGRQLHNSNNSADDQLQHSPLTDI